MTEEKKPQPRRRAPAARPSAKSAPSPRSRVAKAQAAAAAATAAEQGKPADADESKTAPRKRAARKPPAAKPAAKKTTTKTSPKEQPANTIQRTSPERPLRAVRDDETAPAPPSPPQGMGPRGKRLWRDVLEKFVLRPDEMATLESACYAEQRVVEIREQLAGMDLLVFGSTGQLVTNPLLIEVRAHENHVATLLARLKLKDVEAGAAGATTNNARTAAQARWAATHGHSS